MIWSYYILKDVTYHMITQLIAVQIIALRGKKHDTWLKKVYKNINKLSYSHVSKQWGYIMSPEQKDDDNENG